MRLHYKAVTKDGKVIQGFLEAKDINEAAFYLRNKQLLPIHIVQQTSKDLTLENLAKVLMMKKIKNNDIILFTRQMSSMLASGLTLIKSLEIFREQVSETQLGEIISGIISDIEEGKNFSQALSKYPDIFPTIYVSLIRAGESSGLLDKILSRLADNMEKQAKLKSTIKGALMYPIVIVIMMVAVIVVMMIFVIPQLAALYTNLNLPLPLPTQIIVGMSKLIIYAWPLLIGGGILIFFFFKKWRKTERGQVLIDSIVLKLPVFGKLTQQTILTEFSRTFGLLVGAGTLIVESLLETADTTGNIYYKNAIKGVARQVEKGISVGESMTAYPLFPSMLVQLVKVGEQTGKVDDSLTRASEYYEREVNQTVKTLTTAMEPFIMIVLGVCVAFLILSVITPIYSLISSIQ
jgi:type IV pilus assembly protein PilC